MFQVKQNLYGLPVKNISELAWIAFAEDGECGSLEYEAIT